jgi:hypothetical protein
MFNTTVSKDLLIYVFEKYNFFNIHDIGFVYLNFDLILYRNFYEKFEFLFNLNNKNSSIYDSVKNSKIMKNLIDSIGFDSFLFLVNFSNIDYKNYKNLQLINLVLYKFLRPYSKTLYNFLKSIVREQKIVLFLNFFKK